MAVTACPQWVQTRFSPNAGASRRGRKVSRGRPHFRDVYGVFVPTVARPAAPVGPAIRIGAAPLIATLVLPAIKGLLGSLPVGPPVASDLNLRVHGCSPRRTAFDGESGQPTVARLPEAPSRDIRDNDACAFMPTPAGPYKRSARVHPTSSHARSAATPVRRHHRRWSGLLRWIADALMLDASRDQL